MNNVKQSLNQFPKFLGEEALATDLEPLRRQLDKIETDGDTVQSTNLSQRAVEFLDKLDKRKHNQLIELSDIAA